MARFQTCIHDKAGVTPYYVAEDQESVFVGTLFYFTQIKYIVFVQYAEITKNVKKCLKLRRDRTIITA